MHSDNTSHQWIGGFAGRLLQLQPNLPPQNAIFLAVECHDHSRAIPPREAADAFVYDQATASSAPYHVIFRNTRR